MPNRTSLIRRLADLRSIYTGETDSSVLPSISQGGQRLDARDRALLLEALDHNWATRAMGENSLPPPATHIRQALLPDARTPGQREFEAAVLAAASRAVNYLHLRRPANLLRPARVFRMVRPQPVELVLHVEPCSLAPLLLELMPRITEDDVLGVPGLRARLHRRHVELYLVDTDPVATVLLAGVSYPTVDGCDGLRRSRRSRCWRAPLARQRRPPADLAGSCGTRRSAPVTWTGVSEQCLAAKGTGLR
ncbi:MAG: hypothetical protein JOZ47_11360 [Kutzneria sp.]|nr:hypothetical protein [Kutzneria sp.]